MCRGFLLPHLPKRSLLRQSPLRALMRRTAVFRGVRFLSAACKKLAVLYGPDCEKLFDAPQIIDEATVLLVSLHSFRVPENRRGMNGHKDIRRHDCVPRFSPQLI